jgi:hypothetical protein
VTSRTGQYSWGDDKKSNKEHIRDKEEARKTEKK